MATDKGYSKKSEVSSRYNSAKRMLDRAILNLTSLNDSGKAWGTIVDSSDVVGLKLNCAASPNLSPSVELIRAVVEGLKSAGVKENNVIIWDRSERELVRGGFKINSSSNGVRVMGVDSFDPPFQDELEYSGSVGSLFATVIANVCTAIINIGVLKDHSLSGVCAGMKNFYGAIHNPNKYHDSNCNPYVADLCNHKYIKGKLRLTVIDAIICQSDGGPGYDPRHSTDYNSIIAGFDMVAVDRVSHDLIEKERKKAGLTTLAMDKRDPAFINTASKLGLGEGDISKINIIRV